MRKLSCWIAAFERKDAESLCDAYIKDTSNKLVLSVLKLENKRNIDYVCVFKDRVACEKPTKKS